MLDRLKDRFETDLSDIELQLVIDEANADVIQRFGPHPDPLAPITEHVESGKRARWFTGGYAAYIFPSRAVASVVSVDEHYNESGTTTLDATDYELAFGGRAIRRLQAGTNGRSGWNRYAVVTYVPVNDGNQREEVILKMAMLSIQYSGLTSERVGDYQSGSSDYAKERRALLETLNRGLGFA